MTYPTIHMNGTDARDLLAGYTEAIAALNAAFDKLNQTAPHGRDYYPQGDDAINQAIAEHSERQRKVYQVLKELELLAGHVWGA
jgi:hypothetical protein